MISLRKLSVLREGTPVLNNISLDIALGESIALCGPSGCGKSTLLKTLLGGCHWKEGEFLFEGDKVTAATIQKIRKRSGYIGQENALGGVSVLDAIKQPFQFAAHRSRLFPENEMQRLMQMFSLSEELLERKPSSLSGGQQQRVAIIRVLLLKPDMIIADEPTSALDAETRDAVIQEILATGRTVISTSHDPVWLSHCDRVIFMDNGQIMKEERDVRYG
ncbi:ABC transporter ATP-binding protein [Sansalvadorimonas sp. 2012CJ34-2]|uniref:ABC transporter ATP-binding protein n=1 Tax=Parendozoicomonas callyspongiae TaxID=2942213 RepID=A0ABT0PBN8_9GAMM|nr:ABC transporter ATP-binding protein [Sansalvadorimonas sp. 2012CJ34-2]MCL6268790.1 ABC transporter ATP-binding protein [Sansalvadorimonas sp. 2012CJ34-2]